MRLAYKWVLVSLIGISINYLFWSLVVIPCQQRVLALRFSLQHQANWVQQVEKFIQVQPEPARYISQLDEQMDRLERMLPVQVSSSIVLTQVLTAAKQSGTELLLLKPERSEVTNGLHAGVADVVVSGTYFAILDFMKQLEQEQLFMIIGDLAINEQQEGLALKLKLWWFWSNHAVNNRPAEQMLAGRFIVFS